MPFNFFNKKEENVEEQSKKEEKEEVIASVTYYVKRTSEDVYLDIFINDYEDETVSKMAKILSGLSTLRLSVETMAMIKESLAETEDDEVFVQLVRSVMEQTENESEILQKLTERMKAKATIEKKEKEDQPWIKPSEIIK
tara:strand:+ start:1686 stop:2105 length:420 start_codon:yes stop_codon:yes gene_type:complete